MKKQIKDRVITLNKHSDQWQVQQLFKAWAARLDRLPDAGEVRGNPLRSAPPELTEMVF